MNTYLFFLNLFNGASPSGAAATQVDTFTDTAATALTSHTPTPDGGYSWVDVGLGGVNTWVISDANRARPNDTGEVIYRASVAPSSADYSAYATVYVKTVAGGFVGVGVRQAASAKTLYTAIYNIGALRWELYWIDGASFSLLGSYSQTLSTDTGYHLELSATGTSLEVKIDGVSRITATDSAISSTGYRSIYASGAASNSTGLHLDDFGYTYTAPGGGSKVPWYLFFAGRAV